MAGDDAVPVIVPVRVDMANGGNPTGGNCQYAGPFQTRVTQKQFKILF